MVSEAGGCWDVEIGFTGVGVTMISLSVVVGGALVEPVVITGAAVVVGGLVMMGNVVVVCGAAVVGTITTEPDVVGAGAVENRIRKKLESK